MGGGGSSGGQQNATQSAFQQAPITPVQPLPPVQIRQSDDWYEELLRKYRDRILRDQEQGILPLPGTNDSGPAFNPGAWLDRSMV